MIRSNSRLRKISIICMGFVLIGASFRGSVLANTIPTKMNVNRLGGSDRYETCSLLCEYGWSKTADNIVLVSGEKFPDALSAAPLATQLNAPILLTNNGSLNKFAKKEIERLKPKNVYIIGGQGAISTDIENTIKKMNINVIRIGGSDRFETSIKIAKLLSKPKAIYVTISDNFADALSIASVAAKENSPIILSNKDNLSKDAKDYIVNNKISQSYLIGGPNVISDKVYKLLPNCTRIYGNDRYDTNIKVLNTFNNEFDQTNIFVVSGEDFPDALSCTSLAGIKSASIILTSRRNNENTRGFLRSINCFVKNTNVVGGEGVVPTKSIDTTVEGPNTKETLKIPTYDGSGQECHPKVLYFPNGWNGNKYWMAMTPYPNGYDLLENPSIVVSNSGIDWKVPKGLVNPISPVPKERGLHNSDTHLVYDKEKNELQLWYRFTLFDKEDRILKMTSSDGVHWSKPQLMISFYGKEKCLSPAIILENNTYKMWYINQDFKCMYIESSDGGEKWSEPIEVDLNLTDTYIPWHIDVVQTDIGYETVFCGFKKGELRLNNRVLFWNTSQDGTHFGVSKIILKPSNNSNAWDNKQIYRSTFVKVNGVYKLYYSAMDKNIRWHIGLSQGYSLDDLHGYQSNTK